MTTLLANTLRDRIRRGVDLAAMTGSSIGVLAQLIALGGDLSPRRLLSIVVMLLLAGCGLLGRLGLAPWSPIGYITLLLVANAVYLMTFGPWIGLGVSYILTTALAFIFMPRGWRSAIGVVLVGAPLGIGVLVAAGVLTTGPVLDLDDPISRRRAAVAAMTAMGGIAVIVSSVVRQLVTARRDIEAATALEREQRAERARVEAELARARRADLISQVAAEIGADIGAALAIVQARAQALGPALTSEAAVEALADITEASTTAANTMRSLTAFAPYAAPMMNVWGNVGEAARALAKLLRRTLPARIQLTISAEDDVWVPIATCDLARIYSNLVLNARDAITEAGAITVRVSRAADGATIIVEDTGTGMPPDVLAQLFQPFFTTKAVGRGTGLGLATTRILVERAGGTIAVTSTVGVGTRFTIRLPSADGPAV